MDTETLEQTILIMATMFGCSALIVREIGSTKWFWIMIAFTVLFLSMGSAVSDDGINRTIWERLTGKSIE